MENIHVQPARRHAVRRLLELSHRLHGEAEAELVRQRATGTDSATPRPSAGRRDAFRSYLRLVR